MMRGLKNRLVQVLHKNRTDAAGRLKGLAIGTVFRFNSGARYRVLDSGALVRVDPKPKTKRERRRERKEAGFVKLTRQARYGIYLQMRACKEDGAECFFDGPEVQLERIWKEFHR